MKITIISSLPPAKGISKYTVGLLHSLSKQGKIEILSFKHMYPEFLYPGSSKDKSLKPPNIPELNIRAFLNWYNPFGWIYAGLSVKGQIVHAQWWSFVLAPIYITILSLARFIRRKKIIVTVHNVKPHEKGLIRELAHKSVLKLGHHFIVHSEDNKQKFIKSYNIPTNKISVIPHGVLLPETPVTNMSPTKAREKLGLPRNSKVILFFGIIRGYKGLDTLLEAFATVHSKIPDTRLVIAGEPWESWDSWNRYQKIIDKNNLKQAVKTDLRFIPENEIEIYFKSADIVAFPYKGFEAQSGAGSLALPFGKALVVSNCGSLSQLVDDKRAICEPGDPKDLANKVRTILQDKELQKKLESDSEKITKKLSWDTISKQTIDIYERLVDSD